MTRLALPSLRWMVCGRTRRTLGAHAERLLERVGQAVVQAFQRADLVAEDLRRHLDLHFHLVQALLARQHDLVVRQRAFDRQQRGFDLRGKTLTPRMMNMSSLRRPMRRMRRRVRPQGQGSGISAVMSRVR